MLVVTRRVGETVHIGEEIRVMLIRSDGQKARIGIEAPERTPIVRGELLERNGQAEQLSATRHPLGALPPLPDDFADAFESLRLALARRDSTAWHDIRPSDAAAWLRAMRALIPVHHRPRRVS